MKNYYLVMLESDSGNIYYGVSKSEKNAEKCLRRVARTIRREVDDKETAEEMLDDLRIVSFVDQLRAKHIDIEGYDCGDGELNGEEKKLFGLKG